MDDLKGTFLRITRSVTKTSGELLKSTKLAMSISSEEENLKNLYLEIGKKVHEIYQYGGSLGQFFDGKYKEIQQVEHRLADLHSQQDTMKGVRSCPNCGKPVDRTAEFCPKCGYRMAPGDGTPPAPAGPQPPAAASGAPAPGMQAAEPDYGGNYTAQAQQPQVTQQASKPAEPAPKICRYCHASNEPSAKFCLTCGRML
jgi:hypothetical protein